MEGKVDLSAEHYIQVKEISGIPSNAVQLIIISVQADPQRLQQI
jgi:hypothetical protein